jgi:alcohol dehydrogenase (cytochrome c)
VIALDADTGDLKAYHQYHWNGSWDWDEVAAPILMDVQRNGRTIKGLVHAARSGYLWLLERSQNSISFVEAQPYVRQNVFTRLDPTTGRPEYDPSRKPGIGKKAFFCPSWWGGKDWPPAAYNPETGYVYIPANENLCSNLEGQDVTYQPGLPFTGIQVELTLYDGADHIGELQAWDMNSGQRVWTHEFQSHLWGPVLSTAGGLVFMGGTNDRYFRAFNARTGEVLWKQRTNSGIIGVPSSYSVDGIQYVAVQSGWGVDAPKMQANLDLIAPPKVHVPQGGVLWVFALRQ